MAMTNQNDDAAITKEEASEGGQHSHGNFRNDPKRASEAGKKGAQAQPREAKAEGGRNSHRSDSDRG